MTDFFDPHENISITTGGNLPHWHQNERIQFITFRLADSLPQVKIDEIKAKATRFKNEHPEPWSTLVKHNFRLLISSSEEQFLENGYGSCILAHTDIRNIVTSALKFNDGKTYDMIAYVVMPNHVHILIRPHLNNKTSDIIKSIKRHSSRQINILLGKTGSIWMREYYDRIIRNEDELKHYLSYIQANPQNLPPDQYSLYFASSPFGEQVFNLRKKKNAGFQHAATQTERRFLTCAKTK